MIIDKFGCSKFYESLSVNFKLCFDFIKNNDLSSLEQGKYEIEKDNVFVMIQQYNPKELEECKCEAHKKYIDIQYIIEGTEKIGYDIVTDSNIKTPYNEENDALFINFNGDLIEFKKDMFAIFFPQDGHMPGIKSNTDLVKKAVFKIKI